MKKWLLLIIVLLSCNIARADTITWHDYSATVFDQAKAEQHPVLIFANSLACHWCEEMKQTTFSDLAVIKLINEKYYPVSLDVDSNSDAVEKYEITDLPTIIIFDQDGKATKVLSGYVQSDEMIKALGS